MMYEYLQSIHFAYAWVLVLIIPWLLALGWLFWRGKRMQASLPVTTIRGMRRLTNWKSRSRFVPTVLLGLAGICLLIAMARPQQRYTRQQTDGEGIDIMLCLDISGSMNHEDLKPNRLEAAKQVAIDFVGRRPGDRIGVVIFASESFTQCPLTTDQSMLRSTIQQIRNGWMVDGTAIGDGLATSVDRLRGSKASSRIVILLTDGENNGGLISPVDAQAIAQAFGIKVYTIGVGTDGWLPVTVQTPTGPQQKNQRVFIDEALLTQIAEQTGGKYFRAKDNTGLDQIYREIDQLERSKVSVTQYQRTQERYQPWVIAALALVLLGFLLQHTFFRSFP